MNKTRNRIPELDGIRGVAILIVIVWHFVNNKIYVVAPLSMFIQKITSFFWSGVDLFFILSGFLLGRILLQNKNSKNYFKTFYARRFFRIFPLYYLVLGIYMLLYFSIPNITEKIPSLFNNKIPLWSYVLYCQNFVMWIKETIGAGWLGVTWSLANEEQFYLLLPFLIFFLNKKSLVLIMVILIIAAAVYRSFFTQWYALHLPFQAKMDTLFTGVIIAYLFENENFVNTLKKNKYIIYVVFVVLFCGFIYISLGNLFISYYLVNTWINLLYGFFIIIPLLYKGSFLARILRNRMLGQIGTVSYGIYLLHLIVLNLIIWILSVYDISLVNNLQILATSSVAFIVTLSLSFASYYFFESKLIGLGHRYRY